MWISMVLSLGPEDTLKGCHSSRLQTGLGHFEANQDEPDSREVDKHILTNSVHLKQLCQWMLLESDLDNIVFAVLALQQDCSHRYHSPNQPQQTIQDIHSSCSNCPRPELVWVKRSKHIEGHECRVTVEKEFKLLPGRTNVRSRFKMQREKISTFWSTPWKWPKWRFQPPNQPVPRCWKVWEAAPPSTPHWTFPTMSAPTPCEWWPAG